MKLTQRIEEDLTLIRLGGGLLGGPDAEQLRSALLAAVEQSSPHILIDMSEVSWVNSTGLGILISSHLAARQKGGALKLIGVSKRIESILSVTRLNTVFEIFPSEEEGRRSFSAASAGKP